MEFKLDITDAFYKVKEHADKIAMFRKMGFVFEPCNLTEPDGVEVYLRDAQNVTVSIDTIEQLKELSEKVGNQLVVSFEECEKFNKTPTIEIYNGYRE